MLINEVAKLSNLTKKAVEYYTEQGLICPNILENGYRDFSEQDMEILKKIALFRRLGLSIFEIKSVLANPDELKSILYKKTLELEQEKVKQDILKKLYNSDYIYYHLEDVKNEYGKVKEQRIVENEKGLLDINNVNLVFTKDNGSFKGTDILKYPFTIIHNELGIKKCRFYDLRGSYATKILRNGVEIKDVAEILGHNNIETTENYYISSSNEFKKNANDIFEKTTFSNTIKEISNYTY